MEYTFLRFKVELNILGFEGDDGAAMAQEVKDDLLMIAQRYDENATIEETTG